MPKTQVVLYQEGDGSVPFLEWFDTLPAKAQDKCRVKIERLRDLGHELRRPDGDYLGDGIYELRANLQGQNFRILYFFHGTMAAVLTHGLRKEKKVQAREIKLAMRRKRQFICDPDQHTYME